MLAPRLLAASMLALGAFAFAGLPGISPQSSFAQSEPVIAAGSVLSIEVWKRPELSSEVEVSEDGRLEFPPVGEVRAVGLTTAAVAQRIGDALTAFLRETSYVTVREVYPVTVSGSVARPGRLSLEHQPTLLEAILEAGGPLPGARLNQITVYHPGEPEKIDTWSVAGAFSPGGRADSPLLRRGDLVHVPGEVAVPGTGAAPGGAATVSFGRGAGGPGGAVLLKGVARPGVYALPESADVFAALALAGGPSPEADLRRTRILSRQGGGHVVFEVDLESLRSQRPPRAFPLHDGDVVEVGSGSPGFLGQAWLGARTLTQMSRDLVGAYLLYRALKD